jgi:hypothetical protein
MSPSRSSSGNSDQRIAALEAQVSRLEALLTSNDGGQSGESGERSGYDRRMLLRRGGAVLAGAAGAMALPALTGSAAAADGANLVLGNGTANAEATTTSLNRTVNDGPATLLLSNNTAPISGRAGLGSPPLNLKPSLYQPDTTTSKSGDFLVTAGNSSTNTPTQLLFTHESASGGTEAAIGSVYTDYLANLFQPVTQNSSARAFHQVIGKGQVGQINFNPFLASNGFLIAAVGVLQVNKTQGGSGYLTLYPAGSARPSISAITWYYPNERLSTMAIAVPGGSANNLNKVNVYASLGAEVFFDVVGLFVPSPASVAPSHLGSASVNAELREQRAAALRAQHAAG